MIQNIRCAVIIILLILYGVSTACAQPSVTIPPSDNGVYNVQGNNMDGVAGIQLDITYDAASLAKPTVVQGGLVTGALLSANTSLPGFIKIAIISSRSFSGSGPIAGITFATKTGSGGISSLRAVMIDSNGSPVSSADTNVSSGTAATTGFSSTPGVPFSQTPQQPAATTTQQSGSISAVTGVAPVMTTPTYSGSITLPAEQQQRPEAVPVPVPASPSPEPVTAGEPAPEKITEPAEPSGKPVIEAKLEDKSNNHTVYKGISDLFAQHKGSRNFAAMTALFDSKITHAIVQEPAILLSDGSSTATLTIDLPESMRSSTNFAVNNGKLVSFEQDKQKKGRWILKVLPKAGAVNVTVLILSGANDFEYPLTVAPPVKTSLSLDERGWNMFQKEVGTAAAPLHDLNNDGVRNSIDEYIFIANSLFRRSPAPKKEPAPVPSRDSIKERTR